MLSSYFSQISTEFLPLNVSNLPVCIQNYLKNNQNNHIPILEEFQVYSQIKKAKKPKSIVPGDLPVKLIKKFQLNWLAQ